MATPSFFQNLGKTPAPEIPSFLMSTIRNFNVGQAYLNYHAKHVAPGRSAAPIYHIVGGVLVIGYMLNLKSNRHHLHQDQEARHPSAHRNDTGHH